MARPRLVDQFGLTGWGIVLLLAAVFVAIAGTVSGIAISVSSRNCAYAASRYGRPTHWDLLAGCYIETKAGPWVSLDKYRVFLKEGK